MSLDTLARTAARNAPSAGDASRTRRSVAMAALLALLVGSAALPGASAADEEGRYQVLRARDLLVRIDSSTGQVWTVPVTGDGGWLAMGVSPDAAGQAEVAGRYKLTVLGPGGGRRGGQQSKGPIRLLRTDLATGRGWLAYADPEGTWTLIEGAPGLADPQ